MKFHTQLLIDGQFAEGEGRAEEVLDPASGAVLATVREASPEQVNRAASAAHRAFDGWDAERIASYGPDDTARLLADPGIIRNRLKVEGAVKNARAYLQIREDTGSFSDYLWSFTGGDVLDRPTPQSMADIPVTTPESDALSKALKKRGFTFVGSTICYAFMQSAGLVNDHLAGCVSR